MVNSYLEKNNDGVIEEIRRLSFNKLSSFIYGIRFIKSNINMIREVYSVIRDTLVTVSIPSEAV